MNRSCGVIAALTVVVTTLCAPSLAVGQAVHPETSAAAHHDVSPPLRNIPAVLSAGPVAEIPLRRFRITGPQARTGDPARQTSTSSAFTATSSANFDGIGNGVYGFSVHAAPPDTNGAVGATQYVQWVNTSFAVFSKSNGALVYGPTAGNKLWTGFGGGCETNNDGDIEVLYDHFANRWVMSQFSVSTAPYLLCIAVSTTSDATGTWNRYSFTQPNFPDYPKMGVWNDAYYESFNMFSGNTFLGGRACAFDRNAMLTGAAATQVCFQLSNSDGGLLPSDIDGASLPPAGAPNYYLEFNSSTTLGLWKFHVNFATPAASTFTGPTNITVADFSEACGGGNCIPQSNTPEQLDSLGDRLMFRLAYRNFGDHEAIVANHSVDAGGNVGVRWYELRDPGGTPTIYQQGTYAPDGNYRWMGSVAMDQSGNMALGYSVSSSSMYPSIAITGRYPTDPLGTLQGENIIWNGSGSQLPNLSRWGDYSSLTVDPTDDCTFWYTNEYLKTSGTFNWNTRIANFKFAGCGSSNADYSVASSPTSQTAAQGNVAPYTVTVTPANGFTGNVQLSVTGLPANSTGTFTTNPVDITGTTPVTSTLNVNTTTATPTGTYTLTITATSGTLSHSSASTLTITGAVANLSASSISFGNKVIGATSASKSVTLTNTGSAPLNISGIVASGLFTETDNCGSSLAAAASCTINASFSPQQVGSVYGSVTISDNTLNSPQVVNLSGAGILPVTFSPSSLSFSNTVLGVTSAPKSVSVTNNTAAALSVSVASSGDFNESNTCGTSLGAGATCSVSVTFQPTAAAYLKGAISFAYNSANSPQMVGLSGTGVQPLTFSPTSLSFGNQLLGTTSAVKTLTMTNTSGAAVTFTIGVSGGAFVQTNTCGTGLAAGANCVISVSFAPTVAGSAYDAITVSNSTGVSPIVVNLSGSGVMPLTFSPTSLSFGNQTVGGTSAAKSITVTNTSGAALTINSVSTTGGVFAQTNNCFTTLAAGATCTISATFSPMVASTAYGAVTISDNASTGTQTVSFSGSGVLPVALSPTSLTFSSTSVGTTSAAQNVTLTNNTGATLIFNGFTPSSDFAQTNTCGASIAANGSCTISVTFTPTLAGTVRGSVTIADNATGSPQVLDLYGTGSGGSAPTVSFSPSSIGFTNQAVGTTSPARIVTVTNNGTATLNIFRVTGSTGFPETDTCAGTAVAVGAHCTISVSFSPNAAASIYGAVSITDDAGGSPQIVSLYGTGVLPLTFSPTSLSFGNQMLGSTSAPKSITVTNTSGSAITFNSIGTSGNIFASSNTCGSGLAAGASCSISVTFAPAIAGYVSAAVFISDTATPSPQIVNLSGSGVLPLTFSATSLSFTNQPLGTTSASKSITVTNTSGTTLTLNPINPSSGAFAQTNTCGSSLAAGATCAITVTYAPNVAGSSYGAITITDNAPMGTQSVNLSGSGILPVAFSPTSLTFTSQPLGTTSAAQTITLTNNSGAALTVSGISASAGFAATNTCTSSLAPGGTCTISVSFSPTATGTLSGEVTVVDNASNSPQLVSLSGTGVFPISISPVTLSFPSQTVGTTSTAMIATVKNNTSATVSIASLTASGDFAETNNCGTSLAAGGSCTISVTFTPGAKGTIYGAVSIRDSASNSPQVLNLTGSGI